MRRRDFLISAMLATAAFPVSDLLWTPTKTIFIPPVGGWVAPRSDADVLERINAMASSMVLDSQIGFYSSSNEPLTPRELQEFKRYYCRGADVTP